MAQETVEQLKAKLEEQTKLAAKAQAEADQAKAELEKAANEKKVPVKKVPGHVALELETANGKKKAKVSFVDGSVRCRTRDGEIVTSEKLLALANGKELEPQDIAESPALGRMTQESAVELLSHYAAIGVAFLKVE